MIESQTFAYWQEGCSWVPIIHCWWDQLLLVIRDSAGRFTHWWHAMERWPAQGPDVKQGWVANFVLLLLWAGWCWFTGVNLWRVSSFFKISVQLLTFSFVDLVTVLLAQAPRLAILNSFLLGIVSSSRAINTQCDQCSMVWLSIWAWKPDTKKLLGQMWAKFYDFATKDRSEITFSMIPR